MLTFLPSGEYLSELPREKWFEIRLRDEVHSQQLETASKQSAELKKMMDEADGA